MNLPPGRPSSSLLAAVLAIGIAAAAALYFARAFNLDLVEFAEGPVLSVAERLRQEPVSARWSDQAPYTLSAYGPGYFVCLALLSKLTSAPASLLAGRLLALAAVLATAALIGVGVRQRTGRLDAGLLGALACILSPAVIYWAPALRVDTLGVLFSVAAYLVVGEKRSSLLCSAALIVLGSLVKATVSLTAVPIFLFLLLNQRFRDAGCYALAVWIGGGVLWWLVAHYGDGYFWTVTIRNNLNRMLLANGLHALGSLMLAPFSWLCLAIVAGQTRRRGTSATFRSLFFLAFVVNLATSAVFACREGSHINYFLETCALGSMLIGLSVLPSSAVEPGRGQRLGLAFFLGAVVVPSLVVLAIWPGTFVRQRPANRLAVRQALAQLSGNCHVLADGEWVPSVLASGRTPLVNDPYMLRLLADRKLLPTKPIVDQLADGRVCLLILDRPIDGHRISEPRWPDDILDAMARYFEPVKQAPGLYVYARRHP